MKRVSFLLLAFAVTSTAADAPMLQVLPEGRADGWEERRFSGRTRYRTELRDGVPALRADAHGGASGLYWNREVGLDRWPLLRWRWQVAGTPQPTDEQAREGDDFAARVYVVSVHPVFFWKTRAICYVWAAHAREGDAWSNPYTDNVVMVALRSGSSPTGRWLEESQDVAADFRRHFGEAPARVNAVAVMTDTDQTGNLATAWYAELRFETR